MADFVITSWATSLFMAGLKQTIFDLNIQFVSLECLSCHVEIDVFDRSFFQRRELISN